MRPVSAALAAFMIGVVAPDALWAQATTSSTRLDRLDTDGDGFISRDEIVAARDRLFERLDGNGDGKLDAGEIEELRDVIMDRAVTAQARLANQSRRMDTNGDGATSRDEFRARTLLFDLADRDGDGRLSAAEFVTMRGLLGGRGG